MCTHAVELNLKCLRSTLTQLGFAGSAELYHLSQSAICFLPLWVSDVRAGIGER